MRAAPPPPSSTEEDTQEGTQEDTQEDTPAMERKYLEIMALNILITLGQLFTLHLRLRKNITPVGLNSIRRLGVWKILGGP